MKYILLVSNKRKQNDWTKICSEIPSIMWEGGLNIMMSLQINHKRIREIHASLISIPSYPYIAICDTHDWDWNQE